MSYNFINYNSDFIIENRCIYDSNIGYTSDFSIDGEVDGWGLYDGIHTYTAWAGVLFATLYTDFAMIGRNVAIHPIDAEVYYILVINMLVKTVYRANDQQKIPTKAKIMWVTTADNTWDDNKSKMIDIQADKKWHTYSINMAEEQYWIGDISNLRFYPIYENGKDGDEFAIKRIQIKSVDYFKCRRIDCSYSPFYEHPCPGVGKRGRCESIFLDNDSFFIEEGVNDTLIININEYGYESIQIPNGKVYQAKQLANLLTMGIGVVNIGGFAEAHVVFINDKFTIYSGTYGDGSVLSLKYSKLAEDMGFFDSTQRPLYNFYPGEYPASKYKSFSTFLLTYNQLLNAFDNNSNTYIVYDPKIYNIEGGRSDWLLTGPGGNTFSSSPTTTEFTDGGEPDLNIKYNEIKGVGKTIIDVNHPFNASGRIKKIHICGTSDIRIEAVWAHGQLCSSGEYGAGRRFTTGVKVKIFRPLKSGNFKVVAELDVEDRLPTEIENNNLYDQRQYHTEVDCDIFINKGDLLGVYNINLYCGKSINEEDGEEGVDAYYYRLDGDFPVGSEFTPNEIKGNGIAGLLLYGRSDTIQNRLALTVDLNDRVNINKLSIEGSASSEEVEFNIMRCQDIDWEVNLFGQYHRVGFKHALDYGRWYIYDVPNIYYGKDNLTDGNYTIKNGQSSYEGFTVNNLHVIPNKPSYFWVNGDHEWLGIYHWPEFWRTQRTVWDFSDDPISFTAIFPHGKPKRIHKSRIYFKEKQNFKNFELSTYLGPNGVLGDAYDSRFMRIPNYSAVTLDGLEYSDAVGNRDTVANYLFTNPSIGEGKIKLTSGPGYYFPGDATIPGDWEYYAGGHITNYDSWVRSLNLYWNILEHKWPAIDTYGFRFYTDFHRSTAITEFELYGYIESFPTDIASSLYVSSSFYGDMWFNHSVEQIDINSAHCYIDNSIRYLYLELEPVDKLYIFDITADTTDSYVYYGDKGCEDTLFLTTNKLDELNPSQEITIKNVYGGSYNLFIDVPRSSGYNERVLYYSKLDTPESFTDPIIGPAARLSYKDSYYLLNQDHTFSINCDSYGLINSVLNKKAFYSEDNLISWYPYKYGDTIDSDYINVYNLPKAAYSVLNITDMGRSRYWRLNATSYFNNIKIYELKIYKNGNLLDCTFYHNKNDNVHLGKNGEEAIHLKTNSVVSSYYRLTENHYITIDLGEVDSFDTIVIYHDNIIDFANTASTTPNYFCGIDKCTYLYIEDDIYGDFVKDSSYKEHPVIKTEEVAHDNTYTTLIHEKSFDFATDLVSYYDWSFAKYTEGDKVEYVTNSGTTISGTTTSGSSYFYVDVASVANSSPYLVVAQDDPYSFTYSSYRGLNNTPFNIKTSITYDFTMPSETTYHDSDTFCFGMLGKHARITYYTYGFVGAYVMYSNRHGYGIWVKDTMNNYDYDAKSIISYKIPEGETHYYDFKYDGKELYTLKVWRDKYDGDDVVCNLTLTSDLEWNAYHLGFGIAESDHLDRLKFKIHDFSIYSEFIVHSGMQYWESGLKFNGSENSLLSIPYNLDFDLDKYKYTFDFFMRADKFPIPAYDSTNMHTVVPYNIITDTNGKFGWQGIFVSNDSSYIRLVQNERFDLNDTEFAFDFLATFDSTFDKSSFVYREGAFCFYYDFVYSRFVFEGYDSVGNVDPNLYAQVDFICLPYIRYHICVCRRIDDIMFFVDGSLVGTSTINGAYRFPIDFSWAAKYDLYIGANKSEGTIGNFFVGALEEFRFSKGISRWSENFTLSSTAYTPDTYTEVLIKFDRHYAILFENYNYEFNVSTDQRAFSLKLVHRDARVLLEYTVNSSAPLLMNIAKGNCYMRENCWYNIILTNCTLPSKSFGLLVNGQLQYENSNYSSAKVTIAPGYNDLIIGKYFKGNIKAFRFSKSPTNLNVDYDGVRMDFGTYSGYHEVSIPSYGYSKLYELGLYSSYDSYYYSKVYDLDCMFNNSYNHYNILNMFSYYYNKFFAIDLGKRYDLDFIRSYGSTDAHDFDIDTNIFYSSAETDQVLDIFEKFDPTDYFEEYDRTVPVNYHVVKDVKTILYNLDNSLYFLIQNSNTEDTYATAVSKYYCIGNFDLQYRLYIYEDSNFDWSFKFNIKNVNNTESIYIERGFITGNSKYVIRHRDKYYSSYHVAFEANTFDIVQDIRVVKEQKAFTFYTKNIEAVNWERLFSVQVNTDFWDYSRFEFQLGSYGNNYPMVSTGVDRVILNGGNFYKSDSTNARWVIVGLLNGDNVSRFINKMGIYTKIQTVVAPGGGYNNSWDSLGNSITTSKRRINLALGAMVEASSYVSDMFPENVVNGSTSFGYTNVWGTEDETNPFLIIDLDSVHSVGEIVIHHGLFESDVYMINNYSVLYSINGADYTTLVTITDNSEPVRTHKVFPSIQMRFVKIAISKYTSKAVYFRDSDKVSSYYFRGATLREVEIIEDNSSLITISSEEYPVIATNLKAHGYVSPLQEFEFELANDLDSTGSHIYLGRKNYITDYIKPGDLIIVYDDRNNRHEVVVKNVDFNLQYYGYYVTAISYSGRAIPAGTLATLISYRYDTGIVDDNGSITSWPTLPENVCHSTSYLSDIRKVAFREYGTGGGYDKWVVIRNNTATDYNSGPDYFNEFKVKTLTKPNPVNYWWWWISDISTISNSMEYAPIISSTLLKINYPNSTILDHIRLEEVSNFGTDDDWSWRDGITFILYIHNINNINSEDGYFYIKGIDATSYKNKVQYEWDMATVFPFLKEGKNSLFLRFKEATEVTYTKKDNIYVDVDYDTRDFSRVVIDNIGLKVGGNGNGNFELLFDGFIINKNVFESYLIKQDRYERGCYVRRGIELALPISDLSLSSGFISFWMSPDYESNGVDIYGNNKIRNIFTIINNNNDVFGCFISNYCIEVYFGNIINGKLKNYSLGNIQQTTIFNAGDSFHFAVTFSNNGEAISSDNSTVKIFINNQLYATVYDKWEYSDSKYLKLNIGGSTPHAAIAAMPLDNSSIDAVIGDLKVGNYCKTDFTKEMEESFDINSISVINSNDLIEISKDNINFYKAGAETLPFSFNQVPDESEVTLYVRSNLENKTEDLLRYRTSNLLIQWELPV